MVSGNRKIRIEVEPPFNFVLWRQVLRVETF